MDFTIDMSRIALTAVVALRLGILFGLLPLLSARTVPVLWRLALAVAMAAAVAPTLPLPAGAAADLLDWRAVAGEAVTSAVAGALLAFAVAIPFAAVQFAGEIVSMQMGFSLLRAFDPTSGTQMSAVSQLYYLLAVILFFTLDAHHVVLAALVDSFRILPPFGGLAADAGAWHVVGRFSAFFRVGLQIAAPCIIVLLLVSAAMGVLVKTVPQLNILIVGLPIKIAVGLAAVGFSLVFFNEIFAGLLGSMAEEMAGALGALRA